MTVASLATTTHSRPATRPMPVMIPAAGRLAVVEPVRGQRRELEERAARVEQGVDPLAGQQLAAVDVPLAGALTPAEGHALQLVGEVGGQLGVRGGVAGGASASADAARGSTGASTGRG